MTLRRLLALGGFLSCSALPLTGQAGAPGPEACNLPPSWNPGELTAKAWPDGHGRVFILAWRIMEDKRTVHIEECLVLKTLDGGSVFQLTHLARTSLDANPQWHVAMTHVAPPHGRHELGMTLYHTARFKDRPTSQEIYAALAEPRVNWSFEVEPGWKVLGAEVCESSWLEALGEKPTRFYRH